MVSKIRLLNEQTINKIAAGEVIENPSSVVKELVENSLDAGSTEICVEIKAGGRQLIRVSDNGCGMNGDDALLCLERHATSKIKEVEDIHSINTMGFRGEAIPSIASISKFTLLTCPKENPEQGTMVMVDGGHLVQCCPIVKTPGTTIEVSSLFFNVPVRKKFQRSPTYDENEILKMMNQLALGHLHVKFELISNEKSIFRINFSSNQSFSEILGERIKQVLGDDFFSSCCPIEWSDGKYTLQGFIGLPTYTRHNRMGQYLFINHRAVYSSLITYGVRQGYGTTLSAHRHPVYALHLSLPLNHVDVNVHPQKREVRFRQEQFLREFISKAVGKALQVFGKVNPDDSFNVETPFTIPPIDSNFFLKEEKPMVDFSPFPQCQDFFPDTSLFEMKKEEKEKSFPLFSCSVAAPKIPNPSIICTFPGYFLLDPSAFGREGLFLIADQRAVHSRIIFERFKQQGQSSKSLSVQTLIVPYSWETTPTEACLIRDNLPYFRQFGIHIEEIGPNSFVIDAIPELFGNTDLALLVAETMHSLRESHGTSHLENEKERQIALAASRAAISGKKRLSIEEAQTLMTQLLVCQTPFQCPYGKPTMVLINNQDLMKFFLKNNPTK